jgi:hypothetical protein
VFGFFITSFVYTVRGIRQIFFFNFCFMYSIAHGTGSVNERLVCYAMS